MGNTTLKGRGSWTCFCFVGCPSVAHNEATNQSDRFTMVYPRYTTNNLPGWWVAPDLVTITLLSLLSALHVSAGFRRGPVHLPSWFARSQNHGISPSLSKGPIFRPMIPKVSFLWFSHVSPRLGRLKPPQFHPKTQSSKHFFNQKAAGPGRQTTAQLPFLGRV